MVCILNDIILPKVEICIDILYYMYWQERPSGLKLTSATSGL